MTEDTRRMAAASVEAIKIMHPIELNILIAMAPNVIDLREVFSRERRENEPA